MALSPDQERRLNDLRARWERDRTSRLFLQLAEEYRRCQLPADAIAVLDEGLKHHPSSIAGQVLLGRCRLDLRQGEGAVVALEAVIRRDPTHMMAYRHLIDAYLIVNDAERARSRLDLYAQLNSQDPDLDNLENQVQALEKRRSLEAFDLASALGETSPRAPGQPPTLESLESEEEDHFPGAIVPPEIPEGEGGQATVQPPSATGADLVPPLPQVPAAVPAPAPWETQDISALKGQIGFGTQPPDAAAPGAGAPIGEPHYDSEEEFDPEEVERGYYPTGSDSASEGVPADRDFSRILEDALKARQLELESTGTSPALDDGSDGLDRVMTFPASGAVDLSAADDDLLDAPEEASAATEAASEEAADTPPVPDQVTPPETGVGATAAGAETAPPPAAAPSPPPAVEDYAAAPPTPPQSASPPASGSAEIPMQALSFAPSEPEESEPPEPPPPAAEGTAPAGHREEAVAPTSGAPAGFVEEAQIFVLQVAPPWPRINLHALARRPLANPPWLGSATAGQPGVATLTLADLYLKQGHPEEAQRLYGEILRKNPNDAGAQAGLARASASAVRLDAKRLLAGQEEATKDRGLTEKQTFVLRRYVEAIRGRGSNEHAS